MTIKSYTILLLNIQNKVTAFSKSDIEIAVFNMFECLIVIADGVNL